MRAMVLDGLRQPLKLREVPKPILGKGQLLIEVHACGVCRTDLHIIDGDLPNPKLPLIPGHQVVGTVIEVGDDVTSAKVGERRGIPWLWSCCGQCHYCLAGRENLCDHALYTGYHIDGGFAEYCVAAERFSFPIPEAYPDEQAAPLLCAGLIGYRALKMVGDAKSIGFYGFGAAAHILTQVACYQGIEVYAFTKPGDSAGQNFAKTLGAVWAGDSDKPSPKPLDAAIIFAPVGELVPSALTAVDKGGTIVCAGIHMSDIPSFPYKMLWNERVLRSVANLTRDDGKEFLALAPKVPVKTAVTLYPLEKTNQALSDLRHGLFSGAGVVVVNHGG